MEREGGVGFELFVEGEENFGLGDAEDLGAVEEAVGDDVVDLAGFGAEDAGEGSGLVAGEGCGGGGPTVGDPATAGHEYSLRFGVRGGSNGGLWRFVRNAGVPPLRYASVEMTRYF